MSPWGNGLQLVGLSFLVLEAERPLVQPASHFHVGNELAVF